MRAPLTLRARLFLWFVIAIVLAFASSALVIHSSRPEAFTSGTEVMARHMATRLAQIWDDEDRSNAFVDHVRSVTGFDVKLFRDPRALPPRVHRVAQSHGAFAPIGPEQVFVPIVRNGELVGALQMERYGGGFRPQPLWRLGLALGAALIVLAFAAGTVANQLARPLEQLQDAAERFGSGELAFRTDLGDKPKARNKNGWVAREVQGVAVAFNGMAARVEATVRGQRELLGAISHELRSPLGRARVALEIARDRVSTEDGALPRSPAPQLDEIERQLGEVDAILGDLLAVTRAGLSDLQKERVPLAPWLRLRLEDERARGPIDADLAIDDAVAADIDRALLGRALHNLVANARAHGHPDGVPLEVRAFEKGGRVTVAVRDRGPGFAEDFLPRAFEPFVRGDSARSRVAGAGGTGLGLALVRRIAEAHGGAVFARNRVADSDGSGAEVGFELPAALSESRA